MNTPITPVYQYLRCYTELTPKPKKGKTDKPTTKKETPKYERTVLEKLIDDISAPYGGFVFAFDTETLITVDQTFTVGCYIVYGIETEEKVTLARMRSLTREALDKVKHVGLFYNPETVTPDELAIISRYAEEHKYFIETHEEFIRTFYYWSYYRQALVIGHNLPFDISRIARSFRPCGFDFKGGFTFKLCHCHPNDAGVCFFHPPLRVKSLGGKKALIEFTGTVNWKTKERVVYRGKFLDTATFGRALLGPGDSSLAGMGHRFEADIKKSTAPEHGIITPEYLDYNVQDVQATFSLYQKQRDLFKQHGVTRDPWKILSEASLGKAYLKDMGVPRFMTKHKDFAKADIGLFMSTYYGGRSEIKLRNTPAECIYTDFKSQYPTVNALLGLQEFLLAESITVEHNPESIKNFVDSLTVDDLQHAATWKRLRVIVAIKPNQDVLPVRAEYNKESPAANIGVNIVTSGLVVWYTLADVVASKLITGKTPHIVDSIELIPHGRVSTKPKKLFNDPNYQIDLNKDDLFTAVIDLRTKVKQDAKQLKKDDPHLSYLDGIQMALKLLANSTSYGVLVEVMQDEHEEPQAGTVYKYDTQQITAKCLEKPGSYFSGPLGTLIPAGGRLLLAIAEKLGMDRGIRMGMNDTDSAIFIKPDDITRDEFRTRVSEITEFFNPLSPYKQGALFELEDVNFNEETGELEPLYFVGVSTKRYAVFNLIDNPKPPTPKRRGRAPDLLPNEIKAAQKAASVWQAQIPVLRKFTTHGLGHILSPKDYISETACLNPDTFHPLHRWIHDLWYNHINLLVNGIPKPIISGLNTPLLERGTVTSYPVYHMYRQIPGLKPFNFFIVLPEVLKSSYRTLDDESLTKTTFYAPYGRTFTDIQTQIRRRDNNEITHNDTHVYKSIFDGICRYFLHEEAKSCPPDGVGWLERKHLHVIEQYFIGKEHSAKYEMEMQFKDVADSHYMPVPLLGEFGSSNVSELIKTVSVSELAKETGLSVEQLNRIVRDNATPRRETLAKIRTAVYKLLQAPRPTPFDPASFCRDVQIVTPAALSKETGITVRTIYRMLQGVEVKPSTRDRVQTGLEQLKNNSKK